MSGNTIGGIVGGAIGFAIGGPAGAQWGWMIGSVVGGIVDPQVIQGAKWQNQQLQGSSDGLARAVVFGTSIVTGNLLDAEPNGPRIGKKKEGGKGGPEVERDTAILTYAIEICDSSELRGTKVSGIIAVWEDEKLVYDVRPSIEVIDGEENIFIKAWKIIHSKKWDKNKKFYFGGEDQMPPPELEAIHGVGNVPAYRGSCVMVVHDEDLMVDIDNKPRGRIPTYRFLVSVCAPVLVETPAYLATGLSEIGLKASSRSLSSEFSWVGESDIVVRDSNASSVLWATRVGNKMFCFTVAESGSSIFKVADADNLSEWVSGDSIALAETVSGRSVAVVGNVQWINNGASGLIRYSEQYGASAVNEFGGTTIFGVTATDSGLMAVNGNAVVFASRYGEDWDLVASLFYSQNRFFTSTGIGSNGGRTVLGGVNDFGSFAMYTDDGGLSWHPCTLPVSDMVIDTVRWVGGKRWVMAGAGGTSGGGFFVSTDNALSFTAANVPTNVVSRGNGSIAVNNKDYAVVIVGTTSGGAVKYFCSSDEFLLTWNEIGTTPLDMSPAKIWELNPLIAGVAPIPDSPGYYVDGDGNIIGPDVPVGTMCSAPLEHVVRTLHKLGAPQLTDAEFALSPLEGQYVRGYTVQDANVTVADACAPLCKVWNFDLPAYDGKVRAVLRGRAVDWTLTPDDLVAMDSGYDEGLQDESLAFPRKLHFSYTDPNIDYKETTQVSERYSADARVAGEEQISMKQLMMTATEAKRAVVKAHKLSWANIEDTRKLAAPIEYIHAVNSDTFNYAGKRYRLDQMRVEGLQVVFESAAYDRVSSYQSLAIGVEGTPPPDSEGFVRGPTISVFMNMPVLRDEDDKAGLIWAAAGLLPGWKGAALQLSRDGVTFTDTGISVSTAATIGTLLESVGSASRYGLDEVNSIKLKLNPLAGSLESTDMDELLREANAAALLYPDGTVEVIQFLTATETAERQYTLTGLLRGRMNTTVGVHAAGATFVLLNDAVRFVPLRNEDSGTTLTLRAVSNGTVAETNLTATVPLGVLQSLKEWEPVVVRATTGTDAVDVTWAGRGRLGSSRIPVPSLNFKEYRVTVTKGGTNYTVFTTAQAATVSAPGITEPYTTTVTAISRIASQFDSTEGM